MKQMEPENAKLKIMKQKKKEKKIAWALSCKCCTMIIVLGTFYILWHLL